MRRLAGQRIQIDTGSERMIIVKHTWHRLKGRFACASDHGNTQNPAGCAATNPTHPGRWTPLAFTSRFYL